MGIRKAFSAQGWRSAGVWGEPQNIGPAFARGYGRHGKEPQNVEGDGKGCVVFGALGEHALLRLVGEEG